MPSSMCWPPVFSRHFKRRSGSSANQSARPASDQTPLLLIQPPRFVELATSGLAVTTRSATSGAARRRSERKCPRVACVEVTALCRHSNSAGTDATGVRSIASRLRRAAVSEHTRAASVPFANRCQGSSSDMPDAVASSCICSSVSCAAWLLGCPSIDRPRPLIVYAKITVGRVLSIFLNVACSSFRSWPPRSRTSSARSRSLNSVNRGSSTACSAGVTPASSRARTSSGWARRVR